MNELVYIEPSLLEEEMQQLVWVDAMVEEYDSIIRNNVWELVMQPSHKIEENIDQRLKNHPLRGGNLLYIT